MVKYDYFEQLESLCSLSLSAVRLACGETDDRSFSDIRCECDRLVCSTEDALFSDFLPPLEREDLAEAVHTLSRIVECASEILCESTATPAFMKQNDEAIVCLQLADELCSTVKLLRRVRRPCECPDLCGYRRLLSEGRAAHRRMLSKVRSGSLSKKYAEAIILTGRLRSELSFAFDGIIEIMLANI